MDSFTQLSQKTEHITNGLQGEVSHSNVQNVMLPTRDFNACSFPPNYCPAAHATPPAWSYINPTTACNFQNMQNPYGAVYQARYQNIGCASFDYNHAILHNHLRANYTYWPYHPWYCCKVHNNIKIEQAACSYNNSCYHSPAANFYGHGAAGDRNQLNTSNYHRSVQLEMQTTTGITATNNLLCNNQIWTAEAYQPKNDAPYDLTSQSSSYNTYSNQTTFEPKPLLEAQETGTCSFAQIEEFSYDGPLANTQYSAPEQAQVFANFYNYFADTACGQTSKFLPMFAQNYAQYNHQYFNTWPRFPYPDGPAVVPTPEFYYPQQYSLPPSQTVPPAQTNFGSYGMMDNQWQDTNIMRLWSFDNISNELSTTLPAEFDTSIESTLSLGNYIMNNTLQPSSMKCSFCSKYGEESVVYESHNVKDTDGNITCPILQKYICEICGATGEKAHTMKHCPYNSARTSQLPPFKCLQQGSQETYANLN